MRKGGPKDLPFQIRVLFFTTHKQLRARRGGDGGEKGGNKSGQRRQVSRARQVGVEAGAKAGGAILCDGGDSGCSCARDSRGQRWGWEGGRNSHDCGGGGSSRTRDRGGGGGKAGGKEKRKRGKEERREGEEEEGGREGRKKKRGRGRREGVRPNPQKLQFRPKMIDHFVFIFLCVAHDGTNLY